MHVAIESSPFGATRLTGRDANRFIQQVLSGPTAKATEGIKRMLRMKHEAAGDGVAIFRLKAEREHTRTSAT